MQPRPAQIRLLLAVLATLAIAGVAADTRIQFVDAASRVPLEYWVKDADLPLGGRLYWRGPERVFVDGRQQPFDTYRGSGSGGLLGTGAAGTNTVQESLDELSGETRETAAAAIRSDRVNDVLDGNKSQVSGDWETGEHVIEPGGIRFAVSGGKLQTESKSLERAGAGELTVLCHPVEVSFAAPAGAAADPELAVTSNGQLVLPSRRYRRGTDSTCAVRLYLPRSAQPYELATSHGTLTFRLAESGIDIVGTPAPAEHWQMICDASSILFLPAPATATSEPTREPTAGDPELYVFVDRNREVYVEGEPIQLSLRRYGAISSAGVLQLSDGGTPIILALPLDSNSDHGEIELDTTLLRPGVYTAEVTAGGVRSNPLRLQIAPALSATNLRLFACSKWGSASFEPADLAVAARNELNLLCQGAGYAQGGSMYGPGNSPLDDYLDSGRRQYRTDRLGPWQGRRMPRELLAVKNQHDRGAEFLLAHGIENTPVTGGMILYFNVGDFWRHHAEDRYQAVQHFGQEWRRFPNFSGMVHCTGDGPTPASQGTVWAAGAASFDIIHHDRLDKLRDVLAFAAGDLQIDDEQARARFAATSLAMRGALGFGVGSEDGVEVSGEAAQKLAWTAQLNDLYPMTFRAEREALAAMMPAPVVNSGTSWGQGAANGQWTETFYAALDNPIADFHGDYGIVPFAYVSGIDLLGAGSQRRPWMSLDLLRERTFANGFKLFLQAISRNPAGIGFLQVAEADIAGGWGSTKEHGDRLAALMAIGKRFGDLLLTLERRDEVAVLASLRQAALAGQSFARLWGAHFLVSKAGYQANFVTERQVLADPDLLASYKAVFLVDMTATLPDVLRQRLTRYQESGGVLIATRESTVELPDTIPIESAPLQGANEVNYQHVYARFEPLVPACRDALNARVAPFFSAERDHVHLVRSVSGDLEYWTVFHDGILTEDEYPNGHFAQFLYKGTVSRLRAATQGVLYDALRRRLVDAASGPDGMTWTEDMSLLPGTFYLLAPRPVASLAVAASRDAKQGETVVFEITACDAAGRPFSGRLPVSLSVHAADGALRYQLYRTTNEQVRLKIAGNDPIGPWQWKIGEQATGLVARGEFTVAAATVQPTLQPLETPVFDATAVRSALQKRNLEIALFPSQTAMLAQARTLCDALRRRGVTCRVRVIPTAAVRDYPMNWREWTVEDDEIHDAVRAGQVLGCRVAGKNQFGDHRHDDPMKYAFYHQYVGSAKWVYYRDVILLGRSDLPDNPLTEMIGKINRMLPRNPSETFPAPGEGMVAYAWGPFHYGHDAIVLHGHDSAGLDKAIAALLHLLDTEPDPALAGSPVIGRGIRDCGEVYAALRSAEPVTAATSAERQAVSLMPQVYRRLVEEAIVEGGRVMIKQRGTADENAPRFVDIELASGQARQWSVDNGEIRNASLERFVRSLGRPQFSAARQVDIDGGTIVPVERGLARLQPNGDVTWFYDPRPHPSRYAEAKYPLHCQDLIVSADGRRLLATFYDFNKGGNYGPAYRTFTAAVTVLLDCKTGNEICRVPGYQATRMAISVTGDRFVLLDMPPPYLYGRELGNPDGASVLSVFDDHGKQLYRLEADHVDRLACGLDCSLLLVSYTDTRKYVSVIDVAAGTARQVDHSRVDTGVAVASDSSFGVVAYADGLVRKLAADGSVIAALSVPAAGVPVVAADGTIAVCGYDGALHLPAGGAPPQVFANGTVTALPETVAASIPGARPPQQVFYESLPQAQQPRAVGKPILATPATVIDTHRLTVALTRSEGLSVHLLDFTYQLQAPADRLEVSYTVDGRPVTLYYPFCARPRRIAVPLRLPHDAEVTLTFRCANGVLTGGQLRTLDLSALRNPAQVSLATGGANAPSLRVPNVPGALGDPRVEQVAFAFPATYRGKRPPDLADKPRSDVLTLFNGDPLAAAPLYPTVGAGMAPWDPPTIHETLRSARVMLEFAQPVEALGIGIWEHPSDLPVTEFALECANAIDGSISQDSALGGDWRLLLTIRDNTDYFHAHWFKQPVSARFWRLTIVATPAVLQRLAEIELYADVMSTFDLDGGGDAGPNLDFGN